MKKVNALMRPVGCGKVAERRGQVEALHGNAD